MTQWPFTPQSRVIEPFSQDGGDIVSIGWDVFYLGLDMTNAAETLRTLADGSDGQQGKAVDKLREQVGDAYVQLELAGELYQPLGSALIRYGEAVRDTIASDVTTKASSAETAWYAYTALPGDKDGRDYFLGIGRPEEGSDAEQRHEEEDAAKKEAYDAWLEAATGFDGAFDTWESAWNEAIATIEEGFNDDLEDSGWEKFKAGLNFVAEVLSWAGLVVGIVALFVGGPIVAAIAAAIAVAALVVTVAQVLAGEKTPDALVWAAIDVVPFGKLGRLAHSDGNLGTLAKESFNNFNLGSKGPYGEALQAIKGKGDYAGKSLTERLTGVRSGEDVLSRALTGKTAREWDDIYNLRVPSQGRVAGFEMPPGTPQWRIDEEVALRTATSNYEMAHSLMGHGFKVEGWYTKVENQVTGTDEPSWRDSHPVLKAVW